MTLHPLTTKIATAAAVTALAVAGPSTAAAASGGCSAKPGTTMTADSKVRILSRTSRYRTDHGITTDRTQIYSCRELGRFTKMKRLATWVDDGNGGGYNQAELVGSRYVALGADVNGVDYQLHVHELVDVKTGRFIRAFSTEWSDEPDGVTSYAFTRSGGVLFVERQDENAPPSNAYNLVAIDRDGRRLIGQVPGYDAADKLIDPQIAAAGDRVYFMSGGVPQSITLNGRMTRERTS